MSQYNRMITELAYRSDDQTRTLMQENKKLLYEYNHLSPEKWDQETILLKKILGKTGTRLKIEQPFHCDYGKHIEVGENFYANYNLIILDVAKVKIGDNVLCAPNVGIYTAGHPIHHEPRNLGWEYGFSITIGNNVWIGANAIILPGVTIGDNVVVGAGSVVTKDIPNDCIVTGNPAKVLRKITDEDKKYLFKDKPFDIDIFDK